MTRRLFLVRHGKSSWKDPSQADFDRPLNQRGKRDAPLMAETLAERCSELGVEPDAIVSSPARRALRTAREFAAALDVPRDEILEDEDIYEASLATLVDVVRGLDRDWSCALLVGHNPGFTELVNHLTGAAIDNVPTCGVLEIRLPVGSWTGVVGGGGTLAWFATPKGGVIHSS